MMRRRIRPGRPAVEDELRRDKRVPFVVTQTEFAEIVKAAAANEKTVSTWVRNVVLAAARKGKS
jgi:uncharacterized protein (DUF1778 family)